MMTKKESPKKILLKVMSTGIIYSLLLFVFSTNSNAQESNAKERNEPILGFSSLEAKPTFPGGIEEFYKFVGKNFKTPEKSKLKGKVYITFIIEKDGSLSDFKVIKDIGYGTGEEAVRVLKLCPNWNPGTIDNIPVRTLYSLPITIQTAD